MRYWWWRGKKGGKKRSKHHRRFLRELTERVSVLNEQLAQLRHRP